VSLNGIIINIDKYALIRRKTMKRQLVLFLFILVSFIFIACPFTTDQPPATYTITYDGNGADGGTVPVDSSVYEEDQTVTILGNSGSLVRIGFGFTDWNTAADRSGTDYSPDTTFIMGNADVILYAGWSLVDSAVPLDVTGLSAVVGDSVADLSWTASSSSDVAGYMVYTKETSGAYDTGVDVGNVTGYQVMELINFVSYTFKVTAYDSVPNESAGVETGPVLPQQAESWDLKFHGYGIDSAIDVAVDPNDDFVYVVGYGQDLIGATGYDWWIKKFNPAGEEVTTGWDKQFDGNGGSDILNAVAISPDGSVYVVGYGTDLIDPGTLVDADWWIKKFSSTGTELWEKMFDSGNGPEVANDVVVSIEGGGIEYIYVVGSYDPGAGDYPDWWIKKFSSDGIEDTTNWDQKINMNSVDTAYCAAVSSTYIYIGGNVNSDWKLEKFNKSTGSRDTTNWGKQVSTGGQGTPYSVVVGSDGSVYFSGYMFANPSGAHYWALKKYSSEGVEQNTNWPLSFGDVTSVVNKSYPYSMVITADDNLYVAGRSYDLAGNGDYDWWIKKLDSDGNEDTTSWDKKIDSSTGSDSAHGIAVTSDDLSVYVVGNGSNLVAATDADWWIKKFTSDGVEK
jgi:hypothetical protein